MAKIKKQRTWDLRMKGRGKRRSKLTGNARGLVSKYGLYISRKDFRERAVELGFRKYS
ncbi:Ribosomal protein S14p/S29e [uncultured archaeon]|nr:Ribosomal protein S14p/S29e [uncultured archaeon]